MNVPGRSEPVDTKLCGKSTKFTESNVGRVACMECPVGKCTVFGFIPGSRKGRLVTIFSVAQVTES